MLISETQKAVHELAKEKGWHDADQPRTDGDCIALMHSELSEALEEIRNDRPPVYQRHSTVQNIILPGGDGWSLRMKPEGTLIELADCVIRIMDYCGKKGWQLDHAIALKHAYNRTRPYRHGGKKL